MGKVPQGHDGKKKRGRLFISQQDNILDQTHGATEAVKRASEFPLLRPSDDVSHGAPASLVERNRDFCIELLTDTITVCTCVNTCCAARNGGTERVWVQRKHVWRSPVEGKGPFFIVGRSQPTLSPLTTAQPLYFWRLKKSIEVDVSEVPVAFYGCPMGAFDFEDVSQPRYHEDMGKGV